MNTTHGNTNPRQTAIRIISGFLETQRFPDRELEHIHDHRAQVMQLVYGVIRNLSKLQHIIAEYTRQPPRPRIEACLLCALYELLFMDNSEDYATLNETVNIAQNIGSKHDASFVNALLRRAQRERSDLLAAQNNLPEAIRLEHPASMLERWKQQFGCEQTTRLCTWNNQPAFTTLRPAPHRISCAEYLKRLKETGIDAQPHPRSPGEFIVLPHGIPIPQLPGYRNGLFTIQDPATAMSVRMLDPKPGETILDACAAPGGKTMLIAEAMQGQGILLANDLYRERLGRLEENLARLGWENVHIDTGDATAIDCIPAAKTVAPQGFDAILIDVPCSNTGVIRRRPDVRWRFSKTRLKKILKTQVQILYSAAQNLKKGGRLVYSTCSLEPEENHLQIERWLSNNPKFELEDSNLLFPPDSQTDGAYAARISCHSNP
jgi:16S rRNA (cytosine967-C5)-methyltransferase